MEIAGLDIGTTGCKCTVFNEQGECLGNAYRDYPSNRAKTAHEIDPTAILESVYEVLQAMGKAYPNICGIGVTSFGESFVMTDPEGNPLHMAMLYTDPRGKEECQYLTESMGEKRLMAVTGLRPHEMYSISKMMWIKNHRPEVYEKAACIFLMEDFVIFHLTGKRQIDYSLASRTMAFDIQNMVWSEEIFLLSGIDSNKMSVAVPTGTSSGTVTVSASIRTGLSEKTQVINISHDQIAAAVGAGAFHSAVAVDGAGTVECITPVFDTLPNMDTMYRGYFSVVPYIFPGTYVAYAFSYTGGALLQWCIDTIAKQELYNAKEQGFGIHGYLENMHEDTPGDLLVLPHFAGAATPYMDIDSRGVILGLTTATTVGDIYRGCMEGVVYEMLINLSALEKSGCSIQEIHATGGGSKSEVWMQMKADILNLPVTAMETTDAGTVGCAMLTGITLGIFNDLTHASVMVKKQKTFYPRDWMNIVYMKQYEKYKHLYKAIRPFM